MDETDLIRIRAWIGQAEPPTDAELGVLLDNLGTPKAVVEAVLTGRLSDVLAAVAKWDIDGDYSQDETARISGLQKLIAKLDRKKPDLSGDEPLPVADGGSGRVLKLVRPGNRF